MRRTDHAELFGERSPCRDADFYAFCDRHDPLPIFLATDNAATQAAFAARYGARLRADADAAAALEAARAGADAAGARHTSVADAVADLEACVAAKVFKGTELSSFSDAVAHLRRARGVAHHDDHRRPQARRQIPGRHRLQRALPRNLAFLRIRLASTHDPRRAQCAAGAAPVSEWRRSVLVPHSIAFQITVKTVACSELARSRVARPRPRRPATPSAATTWRTAAAQLVAESDVWRIVLTTRTEFETTSETHADAKPRQAERRRRGSSTPPAGVGSASFSALNVSHHG